MFVKLYPVFSTRDTKIKVSRGCVIIDDVRYDYDDVKGCMSSGLFVKAPNNKELHIVYHYNGRNAFLNQSKDEKDYEFTVKVGELVPDPIKRPEF